MQCHGSFGDTAWLGRTKIIPKSDNECAACALVQFVLELAKVECTDFGQVSK